ncbi:MAG: M23 family metallopeptidase [Candidatus Azambacteria bacterium]|nr:M23 family metallopeptidase [Candidatus Azambacteria bacterium]
MANPAVLINGLMGLDRGTTIGGEVTEIVSSSPLQSISIASAVEINNNIVDIDLESAPYDDRDPLITGQDSLLPNQNPITIPTPEPKPVVSIAPAYTAGPYLDGYFIFPTTGFNRGRLHSYNAVDISRGDDCLSENIPVYAAASGVISAAYPTESASRYANGGYGNNIALLHPNGVLTRYAHLKYILVSAGQYVNQGSIIAFMGGYPGSVGSGNSTGCHLHFEVRGAKQPFAR